MTGAAGETEALDITDWPSVPPDVSYRYAGKLACWILIRMRDGALAEGFGTSMKRAEADAMRSWRHWRCRLTRPLAVDGHAYRRRQLARGRRKRG